MKKKKTILALAVASVALSSGAAVAADIMRGPTPYYQTPSSLYNWRGPYLGLNGGYEWGKITNSVLEPSGLLGGLQGGYNWQFGEFVFGGETDIQLTRRQRHVRALEVLQSLVRHAARARRLRAQQHSVLRHLRPRLWRHQRPTRHPRRNADPCRLDRRPRHGGRLDAELVGQGRVSLHGSRQPPVHGYRRQQRLSKPTFCASASTTTSDSPPHVAT